METADVVGLVAPRPFVTVAGEDDHIWPASGARAVIEEAKAIYLHFGVAAPGCTAASGGHKFRPELSWSAFAEALGHAALAP